MSVCLLFVDCSPYGLFTSVCLLLFFIICICLLFADCLPYGLFVSICLLFFFCGYMYLLSELIILYLDWFEDPLREYKHPYQGGYLKVEIGYLSMTVVLYLQQRGNVNHLLLNCGTDMAMGDHFLYSCQANPNCFSKHKPPKWLQSTGRAESKISLRTVNMIG